MTPTNRNLFYTRLEAKWQFRRLLLLEVAGMLEREGNSWQISQDNLQKLLASPSASIRKNTRRWLRFAGTGAEETARTIRFRFGEDTPEGPRRHKLQDLSDGHPFSGVVSSLVLEDLRNESRKVATKSAR
jgi:hypothetical protein